MPDIDTVELPALAGIDQPASRVEVLRSLSDTDQAGLEHARRTCAVAVPVMTMFGVLYWNYQDLVDFTASLHKGTAAKIDPITNCNRLLLNYLAASDALLDHISTVYKRQCRVEKVDDTGFEKLRLRLEKDDDDFEFFSAFRNHTLHSGLPVGDLTMTESLDKGTEWSITHESTDLIKNGPRYFKDCRLLKRHKTVDLIAHIARYHDLLMGTVFRTIVHCFRSDLEKAHKFYRGIAHEVQSIDPSLKPCVVRERITTGPTGSSKFEMLQTDLIGSLKIQFNEGDPT